MRPHLLLIILAALLLCAGSAHAADPNDFSVAEKRLFIDDHLQGLPGTTTLEYAFSKRGSLEGSVDDKARVIVGPIRSGGGRATKVDFLSGERKLELPDVGAATGNPVILYFLEREVREMHRLTGGSVSYYRKRIRMALAEGGQVRQVTVDVGSRRLAATQIHIAPYRDDPARSRYEKFAEKTYTFTLSDDVPGKVVELHSELRGPPDNPGNRPEPVIAETLRFVAKR